jgi:hypothetical protein
MWKKIIDFISGWFMLFMFGVKTFWVILTDDMKKESQEQNEEYERTKNERNIKN